MLKTTPANIKRISFLKEGDSLVLLMFSLLRKSITTFLGYSIGFPNQKKKDINLYNNNQNNKL